ncbi:ISL3 family transposase [Lactiplantibacillus carotarum]|uniref:ISL3 family transposase n=1 Tax=Lactiplantibacillus carotarum TaxID=2993456 RepID=UPI00298F1730|nr:ISL3 family transposase [Lactiplantibacillus carotarum]
MSQDHSTRVLLQIKDPNISQLIAHAPEDGGLRVSGVLTYDIKRCPRCGQTTMLKNGLKTVRIRLPRVSELTTILNLKKQRFICKACGNTVLAETALVEKQHQISENTLHAIDLALTEDRTMSSIAAQYNVSTNTIVRRLRLLGKGTQPVFNGLPTTLCIDEFRSTGNQMSFIAIDAQSHDIITILPGRRNQEIRNYFKNRYSTKNRQQVIRVVMDFNSQYQSVIRELFPNAKLVADNFHLVQMTLRSLNQTRVQLMKQFKPDTREYRTLKHYWRLYLMSYPNLEKAKPQWFSHLKDRLTQEQLVHEGLDLSEQFTQTYFIAHGLVQAFQNRDYTAFITVLGKVENVSSQLMITIKTFIHNKQLIENMTNGFLSNGPIEGVNRKIKQIKRTAYGYRNWQNFIYRIQISFKIKIEKENPIRK